MIAIVDVDDKCHDYHKDDVDNNCIVNSQQKGLGDRPTNSMGGPKPLTFPEKKFLLAVERGDVASTRCAIVVVERG